MAIITTMMAGPLFELVYGRKARETGELAALDARGTIPQRYGEEADGR